MFKVECLGCQAPYQVDERRVPEKGLKMRCPKCGTTFKVEPPARGASSSQAPEPAPEIPQALPAPAPVFTSGGIDPARKLVKPPGSRDSLARTMIGVSSAEMEAFGKDQQAAGKAKPFRIPRPNQAGDKPAAPGAPPAVLSPHVAASDADLPATPARARSFGLSARAGGDEAALPAVVTKPSRRGATDEVQVVLPSASPASPDAPWIAGNEVTDAADRLKESTAPLRLSELPQPLEAPARAASEPPRIEARDLPAPLELDFEENLPIVASPAKRPPPRRHRAAHDDSTTPDAEADLPARLEDIDVALPAAVAPVQRLAERAPRPPPRQKSSSLEDLDLPAIAPREMPPAGPSPFARAPAPPPAVARESHDLSDLPSVPRARPAPRGLSDEDLPAVGKAPTGVTKARAVTTSDLPGVFGSGAETTPDRPALTSDLPSVFGGGSDSGRGRSSPASDLPGVLGGGAGGAWPSDLPGVLGSGGGVAPGSDVIGLPGVLASGLPAVASGGFSPSPRRLDDELPDVLGASFDTSDTGLPEVYATGLPRVADTGLPDVLASGLPEIHGAGLPQVASTGLPDVLAAGLPVVSGAGLPDVLTAGLPVVTPVGLPEVFGSGVAGFGRVDLPLPRADELPQLRGGFDEVDLPGVGESLPSVTQGWGGANLPVVGDALPTAKGQRHPAGSFDESELPFDAFGESGVDPFAGSEADFGAPDGDDPFAAPGSGPGDDGDEFAPQEPRPLGHAAGAAYGEVDIGGAEVSDSSLETADDMEFGAIPQRDSTAPGRAAASASVHVDGPDAEATGSTLELGPERKAPRARHRRVAVALAVSLGAIAGGALALKPAIGPFGIHFVIDQLKRGEHERLLAKLVGEAREASRKDTFAAARGPLRELENARAAAPRYAPLSARSALEHYEVVLRHGPLPNLEATAKVALEQLDPESDEPFVRLARAAKAAATRGADARSQLDALGADPNARDLLGELALRDREWARASELWTKQVADDPASARAAFGLARAQLGLGKSSEALASGRHVLSLNPEHVGAPILQLEALRALQNESDEKARQPVSTDELVAVVQRVLPEASPGEAALAHCVLGELHSSQGRSAPAQQEFEAALVVDRTLTRALIGLGEVLHQAGRHSEALARFEAAANAEPQNLLARLGVAKSQIQLARLTEAQVMLAKLAESHKGDADVIFWKGKAEQALGNNDAALAAYRASIAASQGKAGSVEAYLALAKLQAELGQLALAQETLSEARDKVPPSGPLHKALGEIAMSRAAYGSAYEYFQKALALDPGDTRARFLGAVALTRLGRFEEALSAFQTVGQTDKDFPGLAVERGRLFEESGRNAEALAEYEAALKATPEDPEVQIRVGCSRVVAGQTSAAKEILEKAAKLRPRSAEANHCLGRALFDEERYTDALVRLDRAVSIDPTRAIYHLYVGWVATEVGRQGDALEAFDKAIELDKGLADAYWLRGRLRLKQGAAKDAIVDLEHARQLKPSRYDALADLAVAYSDTGRMAKALDLWEEAIAKDADNPTWHFRYGKLLSSSGNGAMAAAHVKRALALVAESAQGSAAAAEKPKPPLWLWQAHYLLGRELGVVPAAIPHWQAYLRLSPHDDPYRPEAERALRELGQPWVQR